MKRLFLMTVLCLLAGMSGATFELEDPAEELKEFQNKTKVSKSVSKGGAENKVIVPPGANLYAPNITRGECDGWHFDESEAMPDDSNNMQSTTKTTYIGVTIKTIDCNNEAEGNSLGLTLIQIEGRRLIWVESDRVLPVD